VWPRPRWPVLQDGRASRADQLLNYAEVRAASASSPLAVSTRPILQPVTNRCGSAVLPMPS
jgi:hypothetical protein